ncbi:unnamed protein product [Rotaria socialis]|uniref:Amine oxidase domain-containing protein n=1 Tax=Rotaria socialis TaxID=392032 RepID=A0A818N7L7_9BILA|nr:unnamed protein product [Rotaria socialis]CAF3642800.1 unnamed protein product [Rotaria socialis]CAF3684058.1 unnamed protein product [Rotaria socialis]
MIGQEYSQQRLQISAHGLLQCEQQRNPCRQIGIIGAGAAGLYCGILLAEAGHTVKIFEATDRAGGRIQTYRDPQNPSKYMYIAELGAMRFPLDQHPYLSHLIRQRYQLNVSEFPGPDENAYTYLNGILTTKKQAQENPDIFQFNTSQSERGKTPSRLMSEVIQPLFQVFSEEGWPGVLKKWGSYSIESYLNSMNLSREAINYIAASGSADSQMYLSILEDMRSEIIASNISKNYRITDGNDLLVQAMVDDCQRMQSNRCSITYSTPVSQVQLLASSQVRLTTNNGTSESFDTVVVATPPTVTQFFDFEPRKDFAQKYLALRQVHYICASKMYLFFNVSWWFTQENIQGGSSVTDLPIRLIYYPKTTSNQTNGGTLLASYTFSKDSITWQSLSDADAIDLALKQLIKMHRNSSNMRDYFQGGKIKHWCQDPYARGAFTYFTPFQETELADTLQASVSNVHFIGEHTTLLHGWVEGALSSAIRAAQAITTETEIVRSAVSQKLEPKPEPEPLGERLFSSFKATISDRRTKLDAEKVNKLLFLQKNLSVLKKLDYVTTDEPTNLQQKRKTAKTSSTTMPFQAEEETFATRGKQIQVPEQNNVVLSDDDDDTTDKENDEIECF